MDETVTRRAFAGRAAGVLLLCAGLAGGAAARAQALQDPTRPPAVLSAPANPAAATGAGPQLQTILVGRERGGRRLAVIDGATVQVGDTVRGARVTRIGDDEVELKRGAERQVLRLYAQDVPGGVTPADHGANRAGR